MTNSTDTTSDYYRLLGLGPDATLEEIKVAYRDRMRLHHPDLVAGKSEDVRHAATEKTALLNTAYECLSDVDRRSAYDSSRADIVSGRHHSAVPLDVTPRTLRCDVIPGDTVRLTLNVQSDTPIGGDGFQVHSTHRLVAATTFTVTYLDMTRARLQVRVDTSQLSGHRSYQIPIVVTWGRRLTGTATLVVNTAELRGTGFTPPRGPEPAPPSRRHWTRRSGNGKRDLATICLGGIVVPLLMLAWASGVLPDSTPVNPPLVAAIFAGVFVATTWFLTSSRLLSQPDRLARIGVVWGQLMRWSGWALLGTGAVVLGIPLVIGALTLIGVFATPFLGLAVIAVISALFDSRDR